MDTHIKDSEQKMKASIDHLHTELGKVRTGRASVALVEDVKVDYYGNPTPLAQAATLGVPDSKTISITPWDASMLPVIEKAIQASDLGLTPSNDGKVIRLTIPPLTTERRQQLTKVVKSTVRTARSPFATFGAISTTSSSLWKRTIPFPRMKSAKATTKFRKSPTSMWPKWTRSSRARKKMCWKVEDSLIMGLS